MKFSIICKCELKKGYMLYCPVASVPPYYGTERECRKAQIPFEKKLLEEFNKLSTSSKNEVLERLSHYQANI